MRRWVLALAFAATLMTSDAAAVEDRLHIGVEGGLATSTFLDLEVTLAGFNAGGHIAYGVSDAFNLRGAFDLTLYELPDPETSALMYGGMVGAEYVLDTIDWVIYVGLAAGPVVVSIQNGPDVVQAGGEASVGLRYLLSNRFALRVFEGRFRMQLFGNELTPVDQLALNTGLELLLL